jgi:SAM-dependent methyltransferase
MRRKDDPYWYRRGWGLNIKQMSWTEDTANQVDFIVKALGLTGGERILDLACGFGRHALELARRGYSVVGVDLTREYIDDAARTAKGMGLDAEFLCADLRDVRFDGEFDAVLSLADGAIGYLETEEENLRIFDVIARALKPGGRHFMDVCRREHAERFFPKRSWDAGRECLTLSVFDWDAGSRRMLYEERNLRYGEVAVKPEFTGEAAGIRLYSLEELRAILGQRGMEITGAYCDYDGNPETERELQLLVRSER